MKLSKISLALLAVGGTLAASSAFALTAAQYQAAKTAGTVQDIYISGASAQDNGILGSALSYCTGSLHRYSVSNNFVTYCTPDVGTAAGQIQMEAGKTSLAIHKYSAGGSGNGVDPVNLNTNLPFLDLNKIGTSANCSGTNATITVVDFDGAGPLASYTNIACSATAGSTITTSKPPFIGLSDVEPAFFTNDTGNMSSEPIYSLIFAPIVTKNLRDAMQTQQFGATCTGSETEACMPSLSRAQLVSLYTQTGQQWANLGVTSGLTDDNVYVARRVDSSGTQKTFEALLAKTPNGQSAFKSCSVGTDLFVQPSSGANGLTIGDNASVCSGASTTASPLATLVMGGSGGGDVVNCLNNHNTGGRGAIGIQTTESKSLTANWKYVKVDGKAPTQANVAKGDYSFYADASLNLRNGATNPTEATGNGYTKFLAALRRDVQLTSIINIINGTADTFGKSGLMAFSTGAPDFTGATPVNPWNRLVGGTAIDNCQASKATF